MAPGEAARRRLATGKKEGTEAREEKMKASVKEAAEGEVPAQDYEEVAEDVEWTIMGKKRQRRLGGWRRRRGH